MTTWITLLAALLAVYRVATDIAWESGPGRVFERLRGWAQQRYGVHSAIAEGVACPICVSFWVALPAALALCLLGYVDPWLWPVWWLGLAGGAAYLARSTS